MMMGSVFRVILVRILPHLGWIRRDTEWAYRNGLTFVNASPYDNMSCINFQVQHQNCLIFEKTQLVIIESINFLKSLEENWLIFAKMSARVIRGSSNFQVTSSKLSFSAKVSGRDNRGNLNFQMISLNLGYFCKHFH